MQFTDYELIDSGNFEKLERFGAFVLARPEPQALWDKSLTDTEWQQIVQAYFVLNKQTNTENTERGEWKLKKGMPEQWIVDYSYKTMQLKMRLGLTSFKHVGLFPEQAENWNYIFDTIKLFSNDDVSVLNLFAYTGGASLAARAAGANVTHVDSVKQVISWSRENMEASNLDNIRWIVEDALKFVQREVRRGSHYNGIILDPPAYGRGTEGEKWILERSLNDLLKLCKQLLKNENSFVLLNLYSMGYSSHIAQNLLKTVFETNEGPEAGELFVTDKAGRKLPLGIYSRFRKL
jgi:23S rRNA (cytosine1962-C5)-methyltransferase